MSVSQEVSIRPLAAADASAYRALRLRALRDHPEAFGATLEDWEQRTIEQVAERLAGQDGVSAVTLGATIDSRLVGTIALVRGDGKEHHRAHIVGMYVAPEVRRSGIGQALLDEAIRSARRMDGLEMVLLAVAASNDAARRLYVSAGFEPHYVDRRAMKIDDRYVDMEWMRLALS